MKLTLRYYGDPILRAKAKEVTEITRDIRALADAMIEAMIEHNGVGLAAPQIGESLRIYVFRNEILDQEGKYQLGTPQVVINPVFSSPSKETEEMVEGCLSIPGLHVNVIRPKKIHVRYRTLSDEVEDQDFEGFIARVNMHENDHLNGVLHIDRTSPRERKSVENKLLQIKKKYYRSAK